MLYTKNREILGEKRLNIWDCFLLPGFFVLCWTVGFTQLCHCKIQWHSMEISFCLIYHRLSRCCYSFCKGHFWRKNNSSYTSMSQFTKPFPYEILDFPFLLLIKEYRCCKHLYSVHKISFVQTSKSESNGQIISQEGYTNFLSYKQDMRSTLTRCGNHH